MIKNIFSRPNLHHTKESLTMKMLALWKHSYSAEAFDWLVSLSKGTEPFAMSLSDPCFAVLLSMPLDMLTLASLAFVLFEFAAVLLSTEFGPPCLEEFGKSGLSDAGPMRGGTGGGVLWSESESWSWSISRVFNSVEPLRNYEIKIIKKTEITRRATEKESPYKIHTYPIVLLQLILNLDYCNIN